MLDLFFKDAVMKDAILLFAFGFILLIKGGDWFVDGATAIAKKFHIPDILIGATVVSIGTTLPEVMVSAMGSASGQGDLAYGNAIGSIICNTALIAAITIAVKPAEVDRKTLIIPVCFFFGAAVFYSCVAIFLKDFALWVGIVLLITFVIYMAVTIWQTLKTAKQDRELLKPEEKTEEDDDQTPFYKSILLLVLGAFVIAIGATLLKEKAEFIAHKWGVSTKVISIVIVALGTSLPELITAINALLKGRGALSLGNLIGANLFNIVLVSGLAITIAPFKLPAKDFIGRFNASLVLDTPVMLATMAILTIPTILRNKLSKVQGYTLLAIYATFVTLQFVL